MKNSEAYNKKTNNGFGTLVGNWKEETVLRENTGIGRSIPGQHIPKQRDLLYSQEIKIDVAPDKQNTFKRVFPDVHMDLPKTVNQE